MSSHDFNIHDEIVKVEDELLDVVEAKVKSGTTAATVTGIVIGVTGLYLFKGGPVPDFLQVAETAVVGGALSGIVTFITAWRTKHTPRVIPVPPAPTGDSGPAPAAG